jgi:hypothetical protein
VCFVLITSCPFLTTGRLLSCVVFTLHAVPDDRRPAPSTDIPPLQVLPAAVRIVIQSFPYGSAQGPDSLRPQHIKDLLLGAQIDHPLQSAITDLTNLLLQGKVPTSVQGTLFGANLLAITKKIGGIRPIEVGYDCLKTTGGKNRVLPRQRSCYCPTGNAPSRVWHSRWCRSRSSISTSIHGEH